MAICPIIVHFSTWRARSMHDVACEFARAAVRSKDAQKQLAQTSLMTGNKGNSEFCFPRPLRLPEAKPRGTLRSRIKNRKKTAKKSFA